LTLCIRYRREGDEALTFHAALPMIEPRSGGTSSMPSRRIILDREVGARWEDAGGEASGERWEWREWWEGYEEGGCHEGEGDGMAEGGIRWQMKGIKSRMRMPSKEVDGAKGTKW
jgi:hypothetical protein